MNPVIKKPLSVAVSAAFLASVAMPVVAGSNPFTANPLASGYDLVSKAKAEDVKIPDAEKMPEGKCGEGMQKMHEEGKCGDQQKCKAEGKCGEGKCGDPKKCEAETAKLKEGKPAPAAKAKAEGKCGEGACGDMK